MAFKRKPSSSLGLERRVRPRREDEWQEEPQSENSSSEDEDEVEEEGIRGAYDDDEDEDEDEEEEDQASEDGSEDESEPDQDAPKLDLSSVSFGALAKAQESLPSGRKSKSKQSDDVETPQTGVPAPRKSTRSKDDPKPKRSSKHAPQEQTSKKPVSRRREILPDNRRQARDPRFDPLVGRVDEEKASKAYAFLDEYRDKEMADLRVQIKKTKNVNEKENLKRQLQSMESRQKANKRRQDSENLLKEHRKKEKELVAQGKTPFYLKKSEQKKQLLVNRYEGMSKGQVDRAIERKRKKVAGKEKKELDFLERGRASGTLKHCLLVTQLLWGELLIARSGPFEERISTCLGPDPVLGDKSSRLPSTDIDQPVLVDCEGERHHVVVSEDHIRTVHANVRVLTDADEGAGLFDCCQGHVAKRCLKEVEVL
ncbi:hypothetical protein FSARC_6374 [Fusarium sarcochroum]|uniref:rRNA biogenesis protein RRP36 n=1 Tax=Fusarium sarcochroum TaxID=1208366 RepID=A0A8H4X9E5_9HYPO|nr:hypothetical protein FSARC_6374 [Fusarium sarcochroum]